ncbi:MAG TPA: FAD-dependent oxidoreductase [Desulfobacteraceae bacterium]|nr:FAD-dependent oxidoreductase [Desulfobacteraceae bacterium]
MISPKLVEVGRHLNIELLTDTDVLNLEGEQGSFTARILRRPRYVDLSKCTGCGECAKVCPTDLPDEYNLGLGSRKAVYKSYPQAIPGGFAITKRGTAPCKSTCPAHVSIQGYIALINQGEYREALEVFMDSHPFPAVCGRVCHHPCEGICTRGDVEEPLAIQYLHRFLADTDRSGDDPYIPAVPDEKRPEKVAVVGSGPAGLAAAYFLVRMGYPVTVFEKLPVAGGMMAVGIPAYRLPRDVLAREIGIIEAMGVEIKTGVSFGVDITLEDLRDQGYKAFFVATGLHLSRALNVPGEELPGVLKGVDFLRDAALDRPVDVSGRVVVIGGGNVAVDVALTALRKGGEKVTLVCLEKREEMPAWDYEIEEALEEGVEIINSFGPRAFAESGGALSGVEFKHCTAVFDDKGAFCPCYDEFDVMTLEADTVIVAIGQAAELSFAESQGITVGRRGGLAADPVTLETPLPGVFAGGDAFYGPKSVVEAVECGKEAAESIHRYINGLDLAEGRPKEWCYEKPETEGETPLPRTAARRLPVEARRGTFDEINLGFNEEEALREASRCLKCGICSECYQCVKACLAGALDHEQVLEKRDIRVGSVILCPGSDVFDPRAYGNIFRYGEHPNVLTSAEFERILSATGPTMGHITRPSDNAEPRRIAWLQCVGSRDIHLCGNGYCSAVCCMYAVKEAVIAREHAGEGLEASIFFMDMRTFGKDYEKYLIRAEEEHGVRFIRTRVHTVDPVAGTGDLRIKYSDEEGTMHSEVFDMVVLSVGLQVGPETVELAERLGIALDRYNFAVTEPFAPVHTSRRGVYACGIFQGPKDIPSSVIEASAAACAAGSNLNAARWLETKVLDIPDEMDVSGQEPRIGVFVCNCGINIGGIVDVPAVTTYASSLPNVVYSEHNLFTCSQDTQDKMKEVIVEHRLNRMVVASCSPRTHEPLFQETLQACGLNKYLFEMANIRDQDSWVHGGDHRIATEKAKDLVRMAVARAGFLRPLAEKRIKVNKRALVVGGGVAGMNAALGLADQGFETVIIEKEPQLGGLCLQLTRTIEGADIHSYIVRLVERVTAHEKIQVLTNSLVVDFTGVKGNFTTEVIVGPGMYERKIEHGVVILATGAVAYEPEEFFYGEDDRVVTQIELAARIEGPGVGGLNRVVMIQCVGSRNEENPNCSRICCQSAVKNAIHIKELNPETDVFILYRDMRTYGLMEDYYRKARDLGVIFSRFRKDEPPRIDQSDAGLRVTFKDHVLGRNVSVPADLVALSTGFRAADTEELATILKVPRNSDGYFMEAHVKLRPVEMASDGIFVCGTAHSPKLVTEAVAQAMAAASRATTFLSQTEITLSAVTARVEAEKCAACLVCVRSCPYGVPRINNEGVSEIDEAMCHGCGICAAECPAKAIELNWYEDEQLLSKVDALLEGVL